MVARSGSPAARAKSLEGAEEHAEHRRVDERRVGQVDDDPPGALIDEAQELLLQLGRGIEVDLTGQGD